jgi:integrase
LRLVLKYAKGSPSEGWRYRRAVPEKLRPIIGKRELKLFLGETEAEAVRSYARFHSMVERQLRDARRVLVNGGAIRPLAGDCDLARYHALRAEVVALGFDPNEDKSSIDPDSERQRHAEGMLEAYPMEDNPRHPDYASPKLPEAAAELVRALFNGLPSKPAPTLSDALRLYIAEKVKGDDAEDIKKRGRLETVVGRAKLALGGDRKLTAISIADALGVRDHFAKTTSSETVRRYLNDLQGIASHAIWREQLNIPNPFAKLPSLETDPERARRLAEGRKGIPTPELEKTALLVRERLRLHAGPELQNLWLLLELTGGRVKEIAGLRKDDVFLTDPRAPFIQIRFTENRRIKNFSSVRQVPLIPTAKRAAEDAIREATGSEFLFPSYCDGQRGANNASAALRAHVEVVRTDPRIVPHTMRNRLMARMSASHVNVPKDIRERIEGRGAGAISNRYDNADVVFAQMVDAFAKAFPEDFSEVAAGAPQGPPAA